MPTQYIITNNARQRFVERFSENKKSYNHLKECSGCSRCVSLTFKLQKEVDEKRVVLDKLICDRLHEARETRIHHNNHDFMTRMVTKYGDRPAHFLVSEDVIFVVIDSPDGKMCVTCFGAKDSIIGDFVRRPKFKKKVRV